MPTSKTGIWTKNKKRGFTLIELVVVIMILGMIAALIFPRIGAFQAGEMKRTARRFTILIQQMTTDAASARERYRLYFNLDSDEYWMILVSETIREEDKKIFLREKPIGIRKRLPEGMTFEDVITKQQGKVTQGEVFSEFYPIGIEPLTIHLKEKDEVWTLIANPLTGRVRISDKYIEERRNF
ncbi:MAG: type II secretion system protein [Nitrospirota bacterium]